MNPKIFDIIPPDKIMEKKGDTEIFKPEGKKDGSPQKRPKIFLKSLIVLFFVFILVLSAGFYIFPGKTEIEIKPQRFPVEIKEDLILDPNADNSNFESKTISAKIFEDEREMEKDFLTTGKAATEKKAAGTIVVYNEYSASPRALVPSRFVSADGKLFWSTEKVMIPAYTYKNGKIVAGQKEVKVQAAEPGEEYNIEPTTFALPALAGSPLYTTIYAKSFSSMAGGLIGQVPKATEGDLESAEKSLGEEAKQASREVLSGSIPKNYILLNQTIAQQILEARGSVKAGELIDHFKFASKVKSSILAVKKEDIDSFVKSLININIKEGEKILEKSLVVDYEINQKESEAGQMVFKISIKADGYKDIDVLELKKALLGRSFEEASLFLQGLSGVSEFSFKNKPLLRRKISADPDGLQTYLNLDPVRGSD